MIKGHVLYIVLIVASASTHLGTDCRFYCIHEDAMSFPLLTMTTKHCYCVRYTTCVYRYTGHAAKSAVRCYKRHGCNQWGSRHV